MDEITSIVGPVESIDGQLMLRIPLAFGGAELAKYARGIGEIQDDLLIVPIPDWLAEKLHIGEGSTVVIDNADGKFNIHPQATS